MTLAIAKNGRRLMLTSPRPISIPSSYVLAIHSVYKLRIQGWIFFLISPSTAVMNTTVDLVNIASGLPPSFLARFNTSDDDFDRFLRCWRIDDCGKCMRSNASCGWCPFVSCKFHLVQTSPSLSASYHLICVEWKSFAKNRCRRSWTTNRLRMPCPRLQARLQSSATCHSSS